MGSKEIEELIEGEICRIGASRHRIDTKLICQQLKKAHGLNESTVLLSLSYMINTGKIKKEDYRGSETLKLSEERSNVVKESLSTSKVSADNEKVIQYRSELLEIASGVVHDDDSDSTTDSTSNSDSTTDNEQYPLSDNIIPEKSSIILESSPKESPGNAFFTKNENTEKINNSCCEGTKKRLSEIEKHIDHILVKLNDSESSSERKWKLMSDSFFSEN